MARTSGDTLSLNNLAGALGETQNSNVSLNTLNSSAGTEVSLDDYGIDSVDDISGYAYLPENNSDTYTLGFSGEGSRFIQIKQRAANFTWSVPSGTTISKEDGDYNITVSSGENTADASQTVRESNTTNTLRVVFADGFNDHATGYNTNKDKAVYVVDTYDGNAAALCLTLDTPVTKADGTTISAGDVQEGDVLKGFEIGGLSSDSDSNYMDWNTTNLSTTSEDVTVTNVIFSFAERIYNINDGALQVTGEHPLLVKSDGIFLFKPTLNLEVGDFLIREDNSEVEITSITSSESETEVVSIDVETQDTYLINGYITHNKGANSFTAPTPATVTGLSYTDPNLTWTAVAGAADYKVQIDNNSDFSSPTHDYSNWNSTGIEIGDSFFGLTQGSTYYARVAARDAGVLSPWTSTLQFTA